MIVKNILPRARERLAVIKAQAPVREAAALMSKPHTDLIVVCDHGDMVGVLTKTDIVSQIGCCTGAGCTARVDSIITREVTYCRTHEILPSRCVVGDEGTGPATRPSPVLPLDRHVSGRQRVY
jgi:CBS domain-containing protein